jgi:serine/threonine protein kinase
MKHSPPIISTLDASRLADEAIANFLQAAEVGEAPDRAEFVRQHSDVRTALSSFFDAYDQMEGRTLTEQDKVCSFMAGQKLGRHSLVRPIGSGSFGTVWLGFDSQLKRPVAIKVPNQARFSSQAQRDLFLLEAQTVAQLDHPNIVPIYDVGETDSGDVYLVSRFVAGNDLAHEARNRPFSFDETASCMADIASALNYAHSRNVIHRDVKPSNILIDAATKQPYITDFGLACITDESSEQAIAGTPAYMSPEQASGKPLDHRSDVFSLGVVLFELLCGERPFSGDDARTVMKSIREDNPPVPSRIQPQIPDALQTACLKSLSKTFNERYESSEELASDLRAYLDSQSSDFQKPQLASEDQSKLRLGRRRGFVIVGILAIVIGSLFAVKWMPGIFDSSKISSPQAHADSTDRRIAEKTIELGGHVDVLYETKNFEVDTIAAIPEGDIALMWIMFDNFQNIDDEFLSELRSLDSLIGVDLYSCKFSEAGFELLSEVESLRYVHAPDTHVTDKAVASLAALPRLRQLTVTGTKLTNDAIRPFDGNRSLKVLRLGGTDISDEALKYIGSMSNLYDLNLTGCQITDAGIKHLSSMNSLRILRLSQTQITAKSLDYLAACPLKRLILGFTPKSEVKEKFLANNPDCQIVLE